MCLRWGQLLVNLIHKPKIDFYDPFSLYISNLYAHDPKIASPLSLRDYIPANLLKKVKRLTIPYFKKSNAVIWKQKTKSTSHDWFHSKLR